MAQIKVSALTALTATDGNEELLINDGGTSKKVTIDNILHDNSIRAEHYVDGSIATAHIADNAITSAKLGVDVIVAEDIANNAVTVAELAANAVTTVKILDDNVTNAKMADNAIDTAQIVDDAVTADKLANSINTDIATGVTGNTTANAALPKAGGAMTGAITTNSTFDGVDIATRDGVLTSTTTTANAALPKAGGAMTGAITTNSTFDGRDVATDGTKLDGIEASADVTDATNVTAAGALMDSEVTNLAEVKAFAASDYATAAQGTLAANALPKAGGAMTGAITTNSTFDGRDVATDGTKLDGIASSANAYVHPNHSGEVTSTADGATVIAGDVVDEANLKVSNAPTNGYFLSAQSGDTGGLTWAAAGGGLESGTVLSFFQSAAPTGWTQVTSQNNKVLRVVSGTGGGTGGTWATSSGVTTSTIAAHTHTSAAHTHTGAAHTHTSAAHTHTSAAHIHSTSAHTLSAAEMPAHTHGKSPYAPGPTAAYVAAGYNSFFDAASGATASTGSGSSHTHGNTGSTTPGATGSTTPSATGSTTPGAGGSTTPGATGSNGSHSHTISAPQYIDVIICSKD